MRAPRLAARTAPISSRSARRSTARHADKLLAAGRAYRCFCSEERLGRLRVEQEKAKMAHGSGYDRHCRDLVHGEVQQRLATGEAHVVRLKIPDNRPVAFHDLIRGDIAYDSAQLDDLVLLKSDGFPTYHLANVVDDHLMGISHVLRGDEWIASTPKHILIYEAFEWTPPVFAHMPVILAPDGGKLSKRRGAASVLDYQRAGFLSEALRNFLALLGWAPGDDRELMSLEEMVAAFSLERVQAKAAVFDETKLEWMNGVYLQGRSAESLLPDVRELWQKMALAGESLADEAYLKKVIVMFKERSKKICEIAENSRYFFADPSPTRRRRCARHFKPEAAANLQALSAALAVIEPFDAARLEALVRRHRRRCRVAGRQADPPDAAGGQRRQLRPRFVRDAGNAGQGDGHAPAATAPRNTSPAAARAEFMGRHARGHHGS